MKSFELPAFVAQSVRRRPAFVVLLALGLFMPFVVLGCSGYFGFPDWRRSWFTPFETPLMSFGVLCCLAAPWFTGSSIWRRLAGSGLAILGLVATTLIAALTTLIAFGLPIK